MIADNQHMAQIRAVVEFAEVFRAMPTQVDADFVHHAHGQRMNDRLRIGAGGVDRESIAFQVAKESFGHLAATGVSGAENKNERLGHRESPIRDRPLQAATECVGGHPECNLRDLRTTYHPPGTMGNRTRAGRVDKSDNWGSNSRSWVTSLVRT